MRFPSGLVYDSAKYFMTGKLRRDAGFPITVVLDPLGGCFENSGRAFGEAIGTNIEMPVEQSMLSVEQCLAALAECPAPVVSICGGEPLEYPEIQTLVREILQRRKHVFLSTEGTLIRRRLHMIPPYTNFFWNVKLDGTASLHDGRASRPGLFVEALDGVKAAKNAGFFVVVTTTIYPDTNVQDVEELYRRLHAMHVDGYLLQPTQEKKMARKEEAAAFRRLMQERFREASSALGAYNLMNSPVNLEYLRGERELGDGMSSNPVYGPRGWANLGFAPDPEFVQSYAELTGRTSMHSRFADTWKMLAWPFGGNLGEKREGAAK
jgi:hopanoid biosynthesis associated radical SAM protein HpnH